MKVLPGWAGSSNVNGSRKANDWFCSGVWYIVPSGSSSSWCWVKPSNETPSLSAWILPNEVAITDGLPWVPGRLPLGPVVAV